ncbi:hypothetical protein BO78DRAFT_465924 [Aspergillus sclerotiicarbonarius CBS 121057]|uniref:Uncharacterized protein n=1 Tax=Aspergillus sclerotiicarbonarius (strain CBS 121057 / IBT 28362) TaxID=1448318 RepID=A0A319F789_ASPSB|nr:hypothetical protein BO78DRAFT_465924 [Aspergillus sclerotiicarbonarius CBS 121057]
MMPLRIIKDDSQYISTASWPRLSTIVISINIIMLARPLSATDEDGSPNPLALLPVSGLPPRCSFSAPSDVIDTAVMMCITFGIATSSRHRVGKYGTSETRLKCGITAGGMYLVALSRNTTISTTMVGSVPILRIVASKKTGHGLYSTMVLIRHQSQGLIYAVSDMGDRSQQALSPRLYNILLPLIGAVEVERDFLCASSRVNDFLRMLHNRTTCATSNCLRIAGLITGKRNTTLRHSITAWMKPAHAACGTFAPYSARSKSLSPVRLHVHR